MSFFEKKRICFVGLGCMGYPMAGHLKKKCSTLNVFNRSPQKAKKWIEQHGGEFFQNVADAAKDADIVISCVNKDDDLKSITLTSSEKNNVLLSMKKGGIFIDHSTVSPSTCIEISNEAKKYSIDFFDAPISGGSDGANAGKLSIMVGGDQDKFQEILPILQCYGKKIVYIGKTGDGQRAKIVNQICVAGVIQGLAEGIALGKKLGLNMERTLEAIKEGAAGSWQMQNRASNMLKNLYPLGFAVDLMAKDLDIVIKEGEKLNADLETTKIILNRYKKIIEKGGGQNDSSALLQLTEKLLK